ncbi:Uncharacterized protein FWK35_00001835 [Aphis craccivora]|uniref:Uncharacterized protein n=1 Tax=Aphis craccivora TaxID=307492 RepID=A0A6G0ZLI5_APHCR|nr:Uncharacterized protein FWK35_00001835 [Aphis craccivora]
MNLVGALRRSFFEIPNSFQKHWEKPKKIKDKREFLGKTSFRPNRFFYTVVIQKLITVITCNFHQNFMLTTEIVPFEFSNFYEICRKRENLLRNDNDLSQTILNICNYSKSISRR